MGRYIIYNNYHLKDKVGCGAIKQPDSCILCDVVYY